MKNQLRMLFGLIFFNLTMVSAMEVEQRKLVPIPGSLCFEISKIPSDLQNHIGLMMKELIQETIRFTDDWDNYLRLQFFRNANGNKFPDILSDFYKEIENESDYCPVRLGYRFKSKLRQDFTFDFFGKYNIDCCYGEDKPIQLYEDANFETIQEFIHIVEDWGSDPMIGFEFNCDNHRLKDSVKTVYKEIVETVQKKFNALKIGTLVLKPDLEAKIADVIEFLEDPFLKEFRVVLTPNTDVIYVKDASFWNDEEILLLSEFPNLTGLDLPWVGYNFSANGLKKLTHLESINFGCWYQENLNGSLEFMTNLRELTLGYHYDKKDKNNDMGNDDLRTLVNLKRLKLSNNTKVTYEGISHLTNLTFLDIGSAWKNDNTGRIKDYEIDQLRKTLPNLEMKVSGKEIG